MRLLSQVVLLATAVSAEEVLLGNTFEGRPILAHKLPARSVSTDPAHVVVECGSQGNDWNAVAFCESLVTYLSSSDSETSSLSQVDWTIIPKLNPDGYEYSKSVDSNWRKNRKASNIGCDGVNIMHNFPVHFFNNVNSCGQDFSGTTGASEEETQALLSVSAFDAFFSVMDEGDKVVFPFTTSYLSNEHEDLKDVKTAAEGIARFMTTSSGDRYQAVEALDYEATHNPGSILDWAYTKTNYAFGVFMDSTKEEANQPIQQLKLISALESFVENYLANRPVVKKDDNAGWRGIFDGPNVEVYRKIPFAKAPIDNLRFRLPSEPKDLSKISNNQGSVACIQSNTLVPSEMQSEDCLYLNIYKPVEPSAEKLPVK
ncbi:Oidioi.mRNA.OKI2018_I69.chr2.g6239.t1.cds [Oikopleura dioica]|uniref:Oidioi.mRNA.OKI2018_I69.chr2.g6239.t1.cds n=1 Tax=Oikopleura dioica TaxID=34765 RepID=A0ABN7T605_OIKDI|nr:Oidioi.mRNA.OKI2018_I69.chr2.g6239.t1.cds [Oikopleura dioica]